MRKAINFSDAARGWRSVSRSARSEAIAYRRVVAAVAILVFVAAASSGCSRIFTRIDTDELEAAVAEMPGVTAVAPGLLDDGSFGATVRLTVDVPAATPEQVTAVINTIIDVGNRSLDEVALVVDDERSATLSRPATDLNAEQIGADVGLFRQFASAVDSAYGIEWTRAEGSDDSIIRVRGLITPILETLAAIRSYLGTQVTLAYLNPVQGSHTPRWTVKFPFPTNQQDRVQHVLSILALPAEAISIGQQGHIDALTVELGDPATAYEQLKGVIAAVGAGSDRPLWLTWRRSNSFDLYYRGSVDVGRCAYPDSHIETSPEEYLSSAEIDLQERLRREFDTCS